MEALQSWHRGWMKGMELMMNDDFFVDVHEILRFALNDKCFLRQPKNTLINVI